MLILLNQIIKNGYDYKKNHYVFFTASAGQIRTKKCVFINKELWEEKEKNYIYYDLNTTLVDEIMSWLMNLKEGKKQVSRFVG